MLFGHTHQAHCEQLEGGTAGVLEVENGEIKECRIVKAEDLVKGV